ncbi:transposable element Tcb1 transposase [Trichonephila clavipes]|nr:transposable element Tcb1 transposase [Trichonephila clavipes]
MSRNDKWAGLGFCSDYHKSHLHTTARNSLTDTLEAQQYVDDILRLFILSFLLQHTGLTFDHYNARLLKVRVSMNYPQACPTLPLPARLPELSPIEHIWDVMGRLLQSFWNSDDLGQQLETIW